MAKSFNRALRVGYDAVNLGGTVVKVIEYDSSGAIRRCEGLTVPTTGRFAKGAIFVKTDAASGTKAIYENQGTTATVSFNLMGEITSTEVVLVDGDSFKTAAGEEVLAFGDATTAVNEFKISNAATAGNPTLEATGGDTNIAVTFKGKGTGHILLGQATATDVRLAADQPIADSSGNELVKFVKVASAVNEITIKNAATGNSPILAATGEADTGIRFENSEGEEILILDSIATSVNEITIKSAATGNKPIIAATGEADTGIQFENGESEEILILDAVASAVNELTISNAATSGTVLLEATGGDASIPVQLRGKGTGAVYLGQSTTQGVALVANQPLLDSANNELIKFVATGSAVNEFTITNVATGNNPILSATGGDTNIGINLQAKGTGAVVIWNTDAGALGSQLTMNHAGGSQANSDVVGRILVVGQDGLAANEDYSRIDTVVTDVTAATPDSDLVFYVDVAGTLTEKIRLVSTVAGLAVGSGGAAGVLQSNGSNDLTIQTGNATTSKITMTNGAAGKISLAPNTTGIVELLNQDAGVLGSVLELVHLGGSQANSDVVGRILVKGQDDAAASESYSRIDTVVTDITAATPDADLVFYVDVAGTLTEELRLGAAGIKIAQNSPLLDANANELFKFAATGSAVNEFTVTNAATGVDPSFSATGGDTNVGIVLLAKGTGAITVRNDDAGTLGAQLTLRQVGGSQANSDIVGRVLFNGQDDVAALESYAKIDVVAKDVAAASPDGIMGFFVDVAGTLTERMRIDADLVGLQIGDGAANAILQSSGNFDLKLQTGNATSGSITIIDGAAGSIAITPDTTGQVTMTRLQASIGVQTTPSAVTSTVDGLTTGIIAAGTGAVGVTSTDANNIITLPSAVVGNRIMIYLGGTGCELRTPALSNATINTVDSDGTNELALVANGVFTATCNSATNWVIHGWTNLGAAIATLIPDAA